MQSQVGPLSSPVFQVHPLQRCNLECQHCYSDSSPRATAELAWPDVERAVRAAASWGYRVLSISGGEPLMYAKLEALIRLGRELGMKTSVVTNGLLAQRPGLLNVVKLADAVAVSVDGLSESHDTLRGRPRAFTKALAALSALRAADIPFVISCAVTPQNLLELDALAQAVADSGAHALQLHPVEGVGRAAVGDKGLVLDAESATAFYVFAHALKLAFQYRMSIGIDALHRETALARPELVYAGQEPSASAPRNLSEVMGVLVLDQKGNLMPVTYGIASSYWLGTIFENPSTVAERYLGSRSAELSALGQAVFESLSAGEGPDVFNPSDLLAQRSHALTPRAPISATRNQNRELRIWPARVAKVT